MADPAREPAALFPAEVWQPLPRPEEVAHPVAVRRADAPGRADDAGRADVRAVWRTEGPLVLGPAPEGTGDEVLVRFLHHAPQARAVALQANGWWVVDPVDGCDLVDIGEGWWEGTFVVPADWRATYGFLEHRGPGEPPWWRAGLRSSGAAIAWDLSNPLRHAAGRGGLRSVISLAQDGPFDHLPAGAQLSPTLHTLERLNATAPVVRWWASSPGDAGCEDLPADAPLPLLVVLDGFEHADRLGTPARLRRGIAEGALPPLAAVFVESGPHRPEVLGVPGGHAAWIAQELLPHLHEHGLRADGTAVRIDPDPARTVLIGSSFGGLSALFAIAQAPDLIGTVIAQSVSLWRYPEGALEAPLRTALAGRPARLRLHVGRYEGPMEQRSRALVDALRTMGLDATLSVHAGGHDWAWWQPAALHEVAALLR